MVIFVFGGAVRTRIKALAVCAIHLFLSYPALASWDKKAEGGVKGILPKQALAVGTSRIVVIALEAEGADPQNSGVWVWEEDTKAWRQIVPGRFWAAAPAGDGTLWALARGGQRLERYSVRGEKLETKRLPQMGLSLLRVGDEFLFVRAAAMGEGKLLWRGNLETWQPWALEPKSGRDIETLTKLNMLLVSGDDSAVVAVQQFYPQDLLILGANGEVKNMFQLDDLLRGSSHEAPVLDVAVSRHTVLLLSREEGKLRRLWFLNTNTGRLRAEDAPEGAARIVLRGDSELLLVGEDLSIWSRKQ
ncbi:MAG: hypothetical protein ACOY7U_10550 [Acidobacteriota bacterium]